MSLPRFFYSPTKLNVCSSIVFFSSCPFFKFPCETNLTGMYARRLNAVLVWPEDNRITYYSKCMVRHCRCCFSWQVLTTLAGHLIAAKGRVGTTEGMLPVAEMALSMFSECPGLLRCRRERRM